MSRPLKFLAFAAAISALGVASAYAQPIGVQGLSVARADEMVTQSETVFYADLDLSRQAGVKTLMARINGAARNVCGPPADIRDLGSSYQVCVKSAVDHALGEVGRAREANHLALNAQRRPGG